MELRELATALSRSEDLPAARSALAGMAGERAAAVAVAVCANFHMMNCVLDATGCPVPAHARRSAGLLGIALDR